MGKGNQPRVIDPQKNIQEEVQFGKPRIIFRRIRGKIVPISVDRYFGQDLVSIGGGVMTGAAIAGGSVATYRIGKKIISSKAKKAIKRFSSTNLSRFMSETSGTVSDVYKYFKSKRAVSKPVFKKSSFPVKVTKKAVGFVARNPGKLSIAAGLIGLGIAATGAEIQARTRFGFRLPRE